MVDVTVSGEIFSGDGLYYSHSTLPDYLAEDNYIDYEIAPTSAVYTVIRQASLRVHPLSRFRPSLGKENCPPQIFDERVCFLFEVLTLAHYPKNAG